jgi:hypothetical protein
MKERLKLRIADNMIGLNWEIMISDKKDSIVCVAFEQSRKDNEE